MCDSSSVESFVKLGVGFVKDLSLSYRAPRKTEIVEQGVLEFGQQTEFKFGEATAALHNIHALARSYAFIAYIVPEERVKLAEVIHFGLETSDGQNDQEVEKIFEPGDVTEKRREAGHLAAFLLYLFAQVEPVCQGTAWLVGNR